MILFLCDTSRRSLCGVLHRGCIIQIVARLLEMHMVIIYLKYSSGAFSILCTCEMYFVRTMHKFGFLELCTFELLGICYFCLSTGIVF